MITTPETSSDGVIRGALVSRLAFLAPTLSDSVLVEELGLCQGRVRADLAFVTGQIHGYEIKSDRDSLRRLERQVEVYSRIFDRVTLVVGGRHLKAAQGMIPRWWGVTRADSDGGAVKFSTIRNGWVNPSVDPRALVELLWRDEALSMLEKRALDRGIRKRPRQVLWDHICNHFSVEEIAAEVRDKLKARAGHRGLQATQ